MELTITVKSKEDYAPQQQMLADIWKQHIDAVNDGYDLGFITFSNKAPKNPKTDNRRIAGIKAERVFTYQKGERELVKMTVENFIYLMAKVGIDMEIEATASTEEEMNRWKK